ncbi:MAG: Asp-tRNA(Asn)/Glu-tRNA(Gln) amidotransferase subunit GatB [Vulcanimicrobiota bacterium]
MSTTTTVDSHPDTTWEMVIGLEVHVELHTETKLFCACPNRFGAEPNTLVCPVCLGLPGTLPSLNKKAIDLHLRAARALGCKIQSFSKFDRKNYFYPDIPKNFQTSQYDLPLAYKGWLELSPGRVIGITRIHLEEDTGKSTHLAVGKGTNLEPSRLGRSDRTHLDYNRAGVPLLEIVSEPDMRLAEEAYQYVDKLRELMLWLGISDCRMEQGSLRCDANVSLRPRGQAELGVKTEIKNMNSLRSIREAIESERTRQIQVLESGGVIVQETRGWDESSNSTISMRSKEEAQDYRYFPEPDLPSLVFSEQNVQQVDAELPELPAARRERYGKQFGLDQVTLEYLTAEAYYGDFFEQTVALGADAGEVAKWMSNTVSRLSNECGIELKASKLTPISLKELLKLIDSGEVGAKSGQRVLEVLFTEGGEAGTVTDRLGLRQMSSSDSLKPILISVIESNQPIVQQFKEGKEKALNVLVGKVMKETRGAANPGLTKTMLEELIGAPN